MPGVRVVRDGDFVGVVAPDLYTAEKAVAALAAGAKWKESPGQPSNATIFDYYRKNAGAGGRAGLRAGGRRAPSTTASPPPT